MKYCSSNLISTLIKLNIYLSPYPWKKGKKEKVQNVRWSLWNHFREQHKDRGLVLSMCRECGREEDAVSCFLDLIFNSVLRNDHWTHAANLSNRA